MDKIFVCAGMNLAKNEKINQEAKELGYLMAQKKLTYVQGGTDQGLMGATLNAFLEKSKNVKFLIPSAYYDYDAPNLQKLVGEKHFKAKKVQDEKERLKYIIKCDKVIVLPGGTGTLEELLFCNETARAKEHFAKIFLVNIDGFFDGFLRQIDINISEGMTKPSAIKFCVVKSVFDIEL